MLVTSVNTKRNMEIRYNKGMKVNTTAYIWEEGCFMMFLYVILIPQEGGNTRKHKKKHGDKIP